MCFPLALGLLACGGSGSGDDADAGVDGSAGPDAAPGCVSFGFCAEDPFGAPVRYQDVWGAADDAVWVVGEGGAVRFFDGATWSSRDPDDASDADLIAVHGSGPDDVWVVGAAGTIWHWSGAWTRIESGTTVDLLDVSVVGPDEVFVAGAAGTVLRWDGVELSAMATGTTGDVRAVHALRGDRAVASDGIRLLEWNGATWTQTALPAGTPAVHEVHALDDSALLLVAGLGGFAIFRLLDGDLLPLASGGRASGDVAYSMFVRATDDFAVTGSLGLIQVRQGTGDRTVYHGAHTMHGIWLDSTNLAWAVGEAGTILRLEPVDGPLRVVDAGDMHTMLAVHARSASDVWMAGLAGKVAHFDGTTWTEVASGTDVDLHGITAAPDGTIWVAGLHGVVSELGASGPTRHDLSRDVELWSVVPDGDAGVWVAGGALERWDGVAWTPVSSLGQFATDAWSPAPGEIWLAQASGWVSRYVDGVSQSVPSPSSNDLWAIWGASRDDVWVAGYANRVHRWDGTEWTEASNPHSGTPGAVMALWGSSPDDVYAAGHYVLHFDGVDWTDTGLTGVDLRSVHGAGGEVWTVGWRQTFLRLVPQ